MTKPKTVKKITKYAMSRQRISSLIDRIYDRLDSIDVCDTSPNEVANELDDVRSMLSDLSSTVVDEKF